MEAPAIQKRNVAVKLRVEHILQAPFVKKEGWDSSFLDVDNNQVARINLIALAVSKQEKQLDVDDGSGVLSLRIFEGDIFDNISIGDCVQIIGKPREYGDQRYVIPEIVKKTNAGWLKVRQEELSKISVEQKEPTPQAPVSMQEPETVVEEVSTDESASTEDKVYAFIKEQDAGDGVDVQDIIDGSGVENASSFVTQLLQNGDIFEVKPGRVKVLE